MATKFTHIDVIFSHARFAADARAKMAIEGFTAEEVAAFAGCSDTTVKVLISAHQKNFEMKNYIGVCNALDLNPADYFELGEW